jgi:hypothetical protein
MWAPSFPNFDGLPSTLLIVTSHLILINYFRHTDQLFSAKCLVWYYSPSHEHLGLIDCMRLRYCYCHYYSVDPESVAAGYRCFVGCCCRQNNIPRNIRYNSLLYDNRSGSHRHFLLEHPVQQFENHCVNIGYIYASEFGPGGSCLPPRATRLTVT